MGYYKNLQVDKDNSDSHAEWLAKYRNRDNSVGLFEWATAPYNTPPHITTFQIKAFVKAIELEGKGITFKGPSMLSRAKKQFELKGNRANVIAQLEELIRG